MKDYYQILGLNFNNRHSITKKEIDRSFKKLAIRFHPDKTLSQESNILLMQHINEAHQVLSDDVKRAQYDTQFSQFQENKEEFVEEALSLLKGCVLTFLKSESLLLARKIRNLRVKASATESSQDPIFELLSDHMNKLLEIEVKLKVIIFLISNYLSAQFSKHLNEKINNLHTKKKFIEDKEDKKLSSNISQPAEIIPAKQIEFLNLAALEYEALSGVPREDSTYSDTRPNATTKKNQPSFFSISNMFLRLVNNLLAESNCKGVQNEQTILEQLITELTDLSISLNSDIIKAKKIVDDSFKNEKKNIYLSIFLPTFLNESFDTFTNLNSKQSNDFSTQHDLARDNLRETLFSLILLDSILECEVRPTETRSNNNENFSFKYLMRFSAILNMELFNISNFYDSKDEDKDSKFTQFFQKDNFRTSAFGHVRPSKFVSNSCKGIPSPIKNNVFKQYSSKPDFQTGKDLTGKIALVFNIDEEYITKVKKDSLGNLDITFSQNVSTVSLVSVKEQLKLNKIHCFYFREDETLHGFRELTIPSYHCKKFESFVELIQFGCLGDFSSLKLSF